jgi:hypothetical protein
MGALTSEDVQAIDEGSRRWLRGRKDLEAYMAQLEGAVADIRSELKDVREAVYGEVVVVTSWLEQDYTLQGKHSRVRSDDCGAQPHRRRLEDRVVPLDPAAGAVRPSAWGPATPPSLERVGPIWYSSSAPARSGDERASLAATHGPRPCAQPQRL